MIRNNGTIKASVTHGLGLTCSAEMDAVAVRGLTARQLVCEIAQSPQRTVAAQRAAQTVLDVVRSGRILDVERHLGPSTGEDSPGEPIALDDIVIKDGGDEAARTEEVRVAVSEPYVGGQREVPALTTVDG